MTGVLTELGWIQQIVVSQRTQHLVDGHLRLALALDNHEPTVPVLYVDLSEDEERLALATLDPLGAMAEASKDALAALLADVRSGSSAVQQMLVELAEASGVVPGAWGAGSGPGTVDEGEVPVDEEKSAVTCPHCGEQFTL